MDMVPPKQPPKKRRGISKRTTVQWQVAMAGRKPQYFMQDIRICDLGLAVVASLGSDMCMCGSAAQTAWDTVEVHFMIVSTLDEIGT